MNPKAFPLPAPRLALISALTLCGLLAFAAVRPVATLATPASGPAVLRGEPLSAIPAKTVDQCVAQSAKLSGTTVKMTGTVKSVCQQKGCWFALRGKGGDLVRITSMGYKFFVPTNVAGKEATVEGLFEVKTLDPAMAQHYEDDAVMGTGRAPKRVTAPVREFTLAATAVELR